MAHTSNPFAKILLSGFLSFSHSFPCSLSVLPRVTFQVNYLKSLSEEMLLGNTHKNTSSIFLRLQSWNVNPGLTFKLICLYSSLFNNVALVDNIFLAGQVEIR